MGKDRAFINSPKRKKTFVDGKDGHSDWPQGKAERLRELHERKPGVRILEVYERSKHVVVPPYESLYESCLRERDPDVPDPARDKGVQNAVVLAAEDALYEDRAQFDAKYPAAAARTASAAGVRLYRAQAEHRDKVLPGYRLRGPLLLTGRPIVPQGRGRLAFADPEFVQPVQYRKGLSWVDLPDANPVPVEWLEDVADADDALDARRPQYDMALPGKEDLKTRLYMERPADKQARGSVPMLQCSDKPTQVQFTIRDLHKWWDQLDGESAGVITFPVFLTALKDIESVQAVLSHLVYRGLPPNQRQANAVQWATLDNDEDATKLPFVPTRCTLDDGGVDGYKPFLEDHLSGVAVQEDSKAVRHQRKDGKPSMAMRASMSSAKFMDSLKTSMAAADQASEEMAVLKSLDPSLVEEAVQGRMQQRKQAEKEADDERLDAYLGSTPGTRRTQLGSTPDQDVCNARSLYTNVAAHASLLQKKPTGQEEEETAADKRFAMESSRLAGIDAVNVGFEKARELMKEKEALRAQEEAEKKRLQATMPKAPRYGVVGGADVSMWKDESSIEAAKQGALHRARQRYGLAARVEERVRKNLGEDGARYGNFATEIQKYAHALHSLDVDGDGLVDWEEFVRFFRNNGLLGECVTQDGKMFEFASSLKTGKNSAETCKSDRDAAARVCKDFMRQLAAREPQKQEKAAEPCEGDGHSAKIRKSLERTAFNRAYKPPGLLHGSALLMIPTNELPIAYQEKKTGKSRRASASDAETRKAKAVPKKRVVSRSATVASTATLSASMLLDSDSEDSEEAAVEGVLPELSELGSPVKKFAFHKSNTAPEVEDDGDEAPEALEALQPLPATGVPKPMSTRPTSARPTSARHLARPGEHTPEPRWLHQGPIVFEYRGRVTGGDDTSLAGSRPSTATTEVFVPRRPSAPQVQNPVAATAKHSRTNWWKDYGRRPVSAGGRRSSMWDKDEVRAAARHELFGSGMTRPQSAR